MSSSKIAISKKNITNTLEI